MNNRDAEQCQGQIIFPVRQEVYYDNKQTLGVSVRESRTHGFLFVRFYNIYILTYIHIYMYVCVCVRVYINSIYIEREREFCIPPAVQVLGRGRNRFYGLRFFLSRFHNTVVIISRYTRCVRHTVVRMDRILKRKTHSYGSYKRPTDKPTRSLYFSCRL